MFLKDLRSQQGEKYSAGLQTFRYLPVFFLKPWDADPDCELPVDRHVSAEQDLGRIRIFTVSYRT